MRSKILVLTAGAALFVFGLAHCSGGSVLSGADGGDPDGGPPVIGPPPTSLGAPTEHRATADACPSTRPAGYNDADGGAPEGGANQCTHDSDCTQGKNGRCLPQFRTNGHSCSYDGCASDTDCASSSLCQCGKSVGENGSDGTPMRTGNACLPGNCRTDGDCGAGSYCSPTFNTSCGPYSGVVGYYCHTAKDECTRDDQCSDGGSPGYCAYDQNVGKWACQYSFCAG